MELHEVSGETRVYSDEEVIFDEGDSAEHLFVIQSGGVRIKKHGDLVATVLAELGPGDMFGEISLIDRRPHSASATAVGDTEIAIYDKDAFLSSLRMDPELALRVIESLSARLRATSEQLQRVCTQYVRDRTEMALIERAVLESEL